MNASKRHVSLTLGSLLLAAGLAGAAPEPADTAGTLVQDSELKGEPDPSSPTLMLLEEGTPVSLGERRGAWYAAYTEEAESGWLRLLSVRLATGERRPGDSGVRSLLNVGRSDATVTTGVRGLTAEQIMAAEEDRDALERMIAIQPEPDAVSAFGMAGGLDAREVEDPEEPPRRRRRR